MFRYIVKTMYLESQTYEWSITLNKKIYDVQTKENMSKTNILTCLKHRTPLFFIQKNGPLHLFNPSNKI
jgi:hypothetical protein